MWLDLEARERTFAGRLTPLDAGRGQLHDLLVRLHKIGDGLFQLRRIDILDLPALLGQLGLDGFAGDAAGFAFNRIERTATSTLGGRGELILRIVLGDELCDLIEL